MRKVKLQHTLLQADCLLQLAEEADFETFVGDMRRWGAGKVALDELTSAIVAAKSEQRNSVDRGP